MTLFNESKLVDFLILRILEEKSSTIIYKAQHRASGLLCVMKTFNINAFHINYKDEIRLHETLDHPKIVKFLGSFQYQLSADMSEETYVAIITEYLDGNDLFKYFKTHMILEEEVTLAIAKQLYEALKYCHNENIMHRDIKLENIVIEKIINNIPQIKLIDFGHATDRKISAQASVGTVYYRAPEVTRAYKYDKQSDLWSLGVLIYELASGVLPFDSPNRSINWRKETEQLILKGEVDYSLIKSVTLQDLIKNLLIINPEERRFIL
jgi:calcium-dependent protein kinase